MITFITAFKPFDNYYGAVQRSALYSYWVNNIPVIGANTESGTEENCKKFDNVQLIGCKSGKDMEFNNNSPILKDMIHKCLDKITTPLVGLINSDIIISNDFSSMIEKVYKKQDHEVFIVCSRYDTDLFFEVDSLDKLSEFYNQSVTDYDNKSSSDLFITSKKRFVNIAYYMPEFILGRYSWDNWLHFFANQNCRCYNGTELFKIRHCKHTSQHIEIQEGKPEKQASSSGHNYALLKLMQDKYGTYISINDWKELES